MVIFIHLKIIALVQGPDISQKTKQNALFFYVMLTTFQKKKKKTSIRRHLADHHEIKPSFAKAVTAVPPMGSEFAGAFDINTIKMYACPCCVDYFQSLNLLESHINDEHLTKKEGEGKILQKISFCKCLNIVMFN